MDNLRRKETRREMGKDSEAEKAEQQAIVEAENKKREKKERQRNEIKSSTLYKIVTQGKFYMDIADGVLGIFEEVGDLVSLSMGIASIALCVTKLKSAMMTIIVGMVVLIDLVMGMIPGIGSVADFIFPSNTINAKLIEMYVNDDKRLKCALVAFAIVLITTILYATGILEMLWA